LSLSISVFSCSQNFIEFKKEIMQKFLGTTILSMCIAMAHAQVSISGTVTDQQHKALQSANVTLHINQHKKTVTTNQQGFYQFTGIEKNTACVVNVKFIGKKNISDSFIVSSDETKNYQLQDEGNSLEPLEVKAVRAGEKSPFTKTEISKQEIEKNNLGQDLPMLLNQTPSVYVNSDAGNGVGYTSMHIRGSDPTRINITLNGIPYNDAESMGSYFVDLPDFVSSVNSIQIQRGVGTSTNGSGAFGASVNLSTNELHEDAYGEINNSYGSFNTWKNTVKAGSGLINNHFTIDARLSRISSDGYIDRATSNLQSAYLSAAYINNKTSIRFNFITGKEKTYQAWYYVPQDSLATHRTLNLAGMEKPGTPYSDETDNYWQKHYQLFINHSFNQYWSANVATFLTRGYGYYQEYKAAQLYSDYGLNNPVINGDTITSTDLTRQRWLDNYFYGQTFALQYKKNKDEITAGGSWSIYDGKHYGNVLWAENGGIPDNYQYYNYPAKKTDVNFYAKWLHSLNNKLSLFGDMQYRHVQHNMDGFEGNADLTVHRTFDFYNPKAGISYYSNGWNASVSYALAHKEPNRDDFQASLSEQPKAETLNDFELNIEHKTSIFTYSATLYYMLYKDQLVLTGKVNDVGSYTRINVPNSYRAGIELQGTAVFNKYINANANIAFSKNKIQSFTEYLDEYDANGNYIGQQAVNHTNTDISFSPNIIGGLTLNFIPAKHFELSLISKYVSKQYMDNTENEQRKLNDFYTQDARAIYTFKHVLFSEWNITAQVNNIFSRKYEPNGYTYPYAVDKTIINDNYYSPMALINYMIAVNIKL
jgi:iron complex outermembrane receptor protein